MSKSDHDQLINKTWDDLQGKYKELDQLRVKLSRSLLIQQLWDKAFAYGKCTSYFSGGSITYPDRFHEVKFIIENGKGETKTFELKDVPELLIEQLIRVQSEKTNDSFQKDKMKGFLYWYKQLIKRKELFK